MLNRANKLTHPAPPKPIQYPDQASVYSAISYSYFAGLNSNQPEISFRPRQFFDP